MAETMPPLARRIVDRAVANAVASAVANAEAETEARARREMILRQMRTKFGSVPEEVETQVQRITDRVELDRLTDLILSAQSLEEMHLLRE